MLATSRLLEAYPAAAGSHDWVRRRLHVGERRGRPWSAVHILMVSREAGKGRATHWSPSGWMTPTPTCEVLQEVVAWCEGTSTLRFTASTNRP